jgi:hypothetical protein
VLRASGTTNLPVAAGRVSLKRHFPRRSGGDTGCGAETFLDLADKTDEECGAVNQVVPEGYADSFPMRGSGPFTIGSGQPASGVIYMTSLLTPSPVEVIRVELATGAGDARRVIASQEVQGFTITNPTLLVTGGPLPDEVPFPFSLDIPDEFANRPLPSLSLDLTVVVSQGTTGWKLDDPSSYIDIPMPGPSAPAEGSRVEVAIDDPSLAEHVAADLGDDASWAADLDLTSLSDGDHTLYVRVADDHRAAVASTPFRIQWSNQPETGRVEVQIVAAGKPIRPGGWRTVTDTSGHHDLSTWVYSGSIRTLRRGTYELHVRAVRGSTEIARAPKVTFRRR